MNLGRKLATEGTLRDIYLNGIPISGTDPSGTTGNLPLSGQAFLTTSNILNGFTYDSGPLDMRRYTQVQTEVLASHDGLLTFIFYSDAGTDVVRSLSIPYTASSGFQFFAAPTFGYYVRYQFLNNSGSNQTNFYFTTKFTDTSINGQIVTLSGNLASAMTANVGRNVVVGQNPDGTFVNNKLSGQAFLTTDNLLNGITYDSGVLDMTRYTQVQTEVLASHDGSLTFTFYSDSAGANAVRTLTIPYTASSGFQFFGAPTFGYYVRYQFLNNSGSPQSNFYFTTKFSDTSINGQIVTLSGNLASAMTANVGRNVIVGQKVDESFSNVGLTNAGELLTNTIASNRQNRGVFNGGTISAITYAILVDISVEPFTSYTSVDTIEMTCNLSGNNSTCNIKVGVITRIDGTDADISWLIISNFSTANANNYLIFTENYQPSAIQFRSSGGTLVNSYTNDTSANVTAVNTGITLASPSGNITPAVNDVIILFDHTGTNFDSVVSTVYHTY
jgi:hypothetical protein